MNTIANIFQTLKLKGEAGLIGYVTAGDPTLDLTPKIVEALLRGGVDLIELGLPFSDPIADGPTIQAASVRALNEGTTPNKVFVAAQVIKKKHDVPLIIMTYYNPVFKMGLNSFFAQAKNSGVDGLIVPDLPIEEADVYKNTADKFNVDTIFMAAPSTTDDRLSEIVACTSGFLYLVSHFGVTGAKTSVEDSTVKLVKKVLPFTNGRVPLAVGFGVSKPEHVKQLVEAGADGVIVGSAFINIISKNMTDENAMLPQLEEKAKALKKATFLSRINV